MPIAASTINHCYASKSFLYLRVERRHQNKVVVVVDYASSMRKAFVCCRKNHSYHDLLIDCY
jgi:hypothetical protein